MKNTLGGKIDISILQSLVSGEEVKGFVKDYGMVIVDECHHVSAVSFEKILKAINAKYVYGLTATPIRQDGKQAIIYMQCGDIRYRVDAKAQAQKSGFERFVAPRFTSLKKPFGIEDKAFGITQIYSAIAENVPRNKLTDQLGMIALIQSIVDVGIVVIQKPNIHQKFAVADQNIVWYGSINLMSYGSTEESIMRFENMEIAGELLTTVE